MQWVRVELIHQIYLKVMYMYCSDSREILKIKLRDTHFELNFDGTYCPLSLLIQNILVTEWVYSYLTFSLLCYCRNNCFKRCKYAFASNKNTVIVHY